MIIFKICHRGEWSAAERTASYQGSAKDVQDGFLHFSTAEQVMGTLQRHYAGVKDLVLVAVDADVLGPALKFEPSRDGALYPHLYEALPVPAVKWARPIEIGANGEFLPPRGIFS